MPALQTSVTQTLELDETQEEHYQDLLDGISDRFDSGPKHQLLGHTEPLQDDMQLEVQLVSHGIHCGNPSGYSHSQRAALEPGARSWKLLLQLDSDERIAMEWGDSGRLFFWTHEADLAKADFSKVWMILQSG